MPRYRVLQKCYFNDAIREEGDEIEVGTNVFDPEQPSDVLQLLEPFAKPKKATKSKVDDDISDVA